MIKTIYGCTDGVRETKKTRMRYIFAAVVLVSACLDTVHPDPIIHQAGDDLLLPDLQPHPDSHGGTLLCTQEIQYNGFAYAFSAYFVNDNPIIFQLWRPVAALDAHSERDFQLIYYLKVYPGHTNCRSEVMLDRCVAVKPEDFIGLYAPVVPYSVGRYQQSFYFFYGYTGFGRLVNDNIIPLVGDVKHFQRFGQINFRFSLRLLYVTGVTVDNLRTTSLPEISLPLQACPALGRIGAVGYHNSPDGQGTYHGEGSVVILDRFRFNGRLQSWTAHFVNLNEVCFQIWRPVNHDETRYRLVKEYVYKDFPNGKRTITLSEVYPVEAGDHIGYLAPKFSSPDALAIHPASVNRFAYSFWSSEKPVVGKAYDFNYIALSGDVALGATYHIDERQTEFCTEEFMIQSQTAPPLEIQTTLTVPPRKNDVTSIIKDETPFIKDETPFVNDGTTFVNDLTPDGQSGVTTAPTTSGEMPTYVYIIIGVAVAFAISTACLIWFLTSKLRKVTKAIHGQQSNTHQQLQGTYSNVSEYSVYAYINELKMDIKDEQVMYLNNSKQEVKKTVSDGYVSPVDSSLNIPLTGKTSENGYLQDQSLKRSVSTDGYCSPIETPLRMKKEDINIEKVPVNKDITPPNALLTRKISENEYVYPEDPQSIKRSVPTDESPDEEEYDYAYPGMTPKGQDTNIGEIRANNAITSFNAPLTRKRSENEYVTLLDTDQTTKVSVSIDERSTPKQWEPDSIHEQNPQTGEEYDYAYPGVLQQAETLKGQDQDANIQETNNDITSLNAPLTRMRSENEYVKLRNTDQTTKGSVSTDEYCSPKELKE